ncbi:MAG: AAA family ATPase [Saprospiraceae bacterium]|nr:AAA family ATPase [Saprospiraceae bacterium]
MKRYPFKFLEAYTRDDRGVFFGRDEEIEELYQMVFQSDLLLVQGPSGAGKTSLIQCGLAGKFQSHDWLALHIRRDKDINESLTKALNAFAGDTASDLDWLTEDLSEPTGVVTALSPLASRFKAVYLRYFKPLYLIFDQFEELYILGNRDEQQAFIRTVQKILRLEQPVKIIISIREEYLGHLYEFERQVPELTRKKLRVEPMNFERVQRVIEGACKHPESNVRMKAGEENAIAKGIFERIRGNDKTLYIQLPYLQVFLDKFYLHCTGDESRQEEALFTLKELAEMGDIGDVLRNFLEEQVNFAAGRLELKPDILWGLLSPLVTLEGTKEPLSEAELRRSRPEELPEALVAPALQTFVERRVLRLTENEQRYELAHDSLAKQLAERRDEDEIAVLEMQRIIRSQVSIKKVEDRAYITAKQLAIIKSLGNKLKLTDDELDWVRQSEQHRLALEKAEQQRQREELEKAQRQAEQERHLRETAEVAREDAEKQRTIAQQNETQARINETRAQQRTRLALGLSGLAIALTFIAAFLAFQSNKQRQELEGAYDKIEKSLNKARAEEIQRKETEIKFFLNRANQMLAFGARDAAIENLELALRVDSTRQDIRQQLEVLKPGQ